MQSWLGLLWLAIVCATSTLAQTTYTIPPLTQLGPSTAEFVSTGTGFDGPKLDKVNLTSFDWWYFDIVSEDLQTQATIFMVTGDLSTLGFDISVVTSNFGVLTVLQPDSDIYQEIFLGGEVTLTVDGDGSSAVYAGTGVSWTGASDLSDYIVNIDAPLVGLEGTLKFESIAPAHYPCGLNKGGQVEELLPNIGWANAIPDAKGTANLSLSGSQVSFTGPGYHDKNWGNKRLPATTKSWYWGHARVGPYSLVWFDAIAIDDNEYLSGYLAVNGTVVSSSCSGIKVRPTGSNSQYPPSTFQGDPDGFHIEYNTSDGRTFVADVTNYAVAWKPAVISGGYTRWTGNITGGFEGEEQYEGAALYEWIRFWLNV